MTSAPGTIEGACVRCLKTFFSHQNTSAKISSKKRPKNRPARCLIFDVDEPQSGKWRHLHRGRISCSQPKGDASNNLRPRANRGTAKLKSHNSFLKENDQNILFEAKVLFNQIWVFGIRFNYLMRNVLLQTLVNSCVSIGTRVRIQPWWLFGLF